jgi:hypothetical protein
MTDNIKPLAQLPCFSANGYRIEVWPYTFGQYRIMLIKGSNPHLGGPNVIRQMCTYQRGVCVQTCIDLLTTADPELYCRQLEKPWNCEYPGGRIRLDNTESDRPFVEPEVEDNR